MKHLIICASLLFMLAIISCSETGDKAPVALTWSDNGYNAKHESYENTLVLKNISDKNIDNNWTIYFSQLPRDIKHIASDLIAIEVVNANYFKVYPTNKFQNLSKGDSLVIKYAVSAPAINVSQEPEGYYWVSTTKGKENVPLAIDFTVKPKAYDIAMLREQAAKLYQFNESLNVGDLQLSATDIIPSIKQIKGKEGNIKIISQVSLLYSNELANEANILKEKLIGLHNIETVDIAPVSIRLNLIESKDISDSDEFYHINIDTDQILIEGTTPHGVFNGVQTFLALIKGQNQSIELQCVTIADYPDLNYRGFMLDIARNFTPLNDLKKLIDVLSTYKLNVLHLHFSDDEGWRLEIPGLEELTEVGSRRGHTLDESSCLYPGYDGNFNANAKTTGNGYYTRNEFIDLLKYAAARHITVIPELESPGHARAAIKSMEARYDKYINTDKEKALEYLLSEKADTSKYVSAQSYRDNVMNVSLPSTYNFMKKVILEIKNMYHEAGVPLATIHIGGDEVPLGAWEGSPLCQNFMKEKGLKNTHSLFEYFNLQITNFLAEQDLKFNGWQEVALHNAEKTNKQLSSRAYGIHCWSTIPEWGDDEIPYQLANIGYPIILCNVNNFYLDLAYSSLHNERGHSWAGYVDESKSFSMLPFSIYRSSRTDKVESVDENIKKEKIKLKPENKAFIKGVQAQLFSETIRGYDWIEYYVFPKIFGLVERGWNAYPIWEQMEGLQEEKAFNDDLSRFYALISNKEIPYLRSLSVNFRLPNPGLVIDAGQLLANSSIQGAKIHYTVDGSEPDETSTVWTKNVSLDSNVSTIKACIYYNDKKSQTTVLIVKS